MSNTLTPSFLSDGEILKRFKLEALRRNSTPAQLMEYLVAETPDSYFPVEKPPIGATCVVVSLDDLHHENEAELLGQTVTVEGYTTNEDCPNICLTDNDPLIECRMADGSECSFYKENLRQVLKWVDNYGAIPGETVTATECGRFGISEASNSTEEKPNFQLWERIDPNHAFVVESKFHDVEAAQQYAQDYCK